MPPLILDVDDAIYLRQRWNAAESLARRSDLTICGNRTLAEWFADYSRVVVIPTVVDTQRYVPNRSERKSMVIGWMGTSGNLEELDRIAPALQHVLRRRQEVRLRVVSDRPERFSLAGHERVELVHWAEQQEVREINHFDIGIMPLRDTEWTRGKCGFKLLTYLACETAAMASPVGVNAEILGHDQAALASTVDEWAERLLSLVDSPAERRRIGRTGRSRIQRDYSIEAAVPLLEAAIKSVET